MSKETEEKLKQAEIAMFATLSALANAVTLWKEELQNLYTSLKNEIEEMEKMKNENK